MFRSKSRQSFRGGYNRYRSPADYKISKKREFSLSWIKGISKINFRKLFLALVVALLIYASFFSDYFGIKEVIVEGNHLVSADKIKEEIPLGKNIFFLNAKETKGNILADNNEIQDVQIYRGIPNAIKVVVLERENKLVWKTGADRYLLSTQGTITRKLNQDETSAFPEVTDSRNFPVTSGQAVASSHFVAFVQNINDNFFTVTNIKPTTYEVGETTFDLIAHTEAGFYVKLDTTRSSAKQLDDLKKVLVAKRPDIKEYVDLRIDGWAYYK